MARNRRESSDDGIGDDQQPIYVISIAARLVGMHQQTLRYYERAKEILGIGETYTISTPP